MKLMQTFAEKLIKLLNKKGYGAYLYHVSKYDSIYIRFEDKAMCSIRIGDHDGREKYRYKYNIRTDITQWYSEYEGNVLRHYYTINDLKKLFHDIEERKNYLQNMQISLPF